MTDAETKATAEAERLQAEETVRLEAEALAEEEKAKADPDYYKKKYKFLSTEIRTVSRDRDTLKSQLAERARLEEETKNKELTDLEKAKNEVARLKGEHETLTRKAQILDEFEKKQRDELKKELGDAYDPSYDALPLPGLIKLAETIKTRTTSTAPPAGVTGVMPSTYDDALKDSNKMAALHKNPELHARLKREWEIKNNR